VELTPLLRQSALRRYEAKTGVYTASVRLFVCLSVAGLYNIQWNVMATFSNDHHFRCEEVTVICLYYRLGEPPANRLVTYT